jgi:hypothetical protein
MCKHRETLSNNIVNCSQYICERGFLTESDIEIINTGFDLFILLTVLRKQFPNHSQLKKFYLCKLASEKEVITAIKCNHKNKKTQTKVCYAIKS